MFTDPTPDEIYAYRDKHGVGIQTAKRTLLRQRIEVALRHPMTTDDLRWLVARMLLLIPV